MSLTLSSSPAAVLIAAGLIAGCGIEGGAEDEAVGTTSQAILNGTPVDPNGGPHVMLPGCSGYLIDNEWLISAKHCYKSWGGAQIGTQVKNTYRVIQHPTLDLMLQRVESPFVVGGSTRGHNASFFQGTRDNLRGRWVDCYGYGANTLDGRGRETLRVGTMQSYYLATPSTEITVLKNEEGQLPYYGDSGGVCIYTDPSRPDCVNGCVAGVTIRVQCERMENGNCVNPVRSDLVFSNPIMSWLRVAHVTDGLFVQASGDTIYLMQGGARFPIPSWVEYVALRDTFGYSDHDVRSVTNQVIDAYHTLPRDGTFVQERDSDAVYLVHGWAKFWIPSPPELQALQAIYGYPHSNVKLVPSGGLAQVPNVPYDGTFVQERGSSVVYLIVSGGKYAIPSYEALVTLTRNHRKTPAHVGVVPPGSLAGFPDRAYP